MYILSYSRLVLKKQQKISRFFSYRHIWVFPKIGYPQIIDSNRVFPYKPSILGYPYFWKHPYDLWFVLKRYVELDISQKQRVGLTYVPVRNPTFIWWSKNPNATTPEKVTGTIDLNPEKRGESKGKLPHVWPFFWGWWIMLVYPDFTVNSIISR